MTERALVIVDPSTGWPETQGVEEIRGRWEGAARVLTPALDARDRPSRNPGAYGGDGLILLGSRISVHDEPDWAREIEEVIRPILDGDRVIPLLGICWGHQFLAHLAGAEVRWARDDRTKIVGVQTTVSEGGTLLSGRRELRVVVSHREIVGEVPPGYRVVASRPDASIDGIEHDRLPIFAYQFHPEARDEFARSAGFDPALVDDRVRVDSGAVIDAFLDRVREN